MYESDYFSSMSFTTDCYFIVMKMAVWLSGIYSEEKYVESESRKPHGPYVADAYADVDEEEEEYGDRTDYR